MNRADDLRADYDRLGELLDTAEGSAAAAIARERRMIGELLETLEASALEVPLVDKLAANVTPLVRRGGTGAADSRPAPRRRKSG